MMDRPAWPLRIAYGTALVDVEQQVIEETVKSCGYRISIAAKVLGISQRKVYYKLRRYEADREYLEGSK